MSKGINKNTHKLSGVYEIRNTLNNKRYIGSSMFGFKWKYKNYDNKIDINQNSDS